MYKFNDAVKLSPSSRGKGERMSGEIRISFSKAQGEINPVSRGLEAFIIGGKELLVVVAREEIRS